MRTQNPKLIIVEVNGALYGSNENIESEANLRNYSDNIPFNSNKVELVSNNATSDQLEYYMTISLNSRQNSTISGWSKINSSDTI